MTGLNEIKVLFQKNFPIIPENLLEDFQVETQGENARRVKILGVSFIVISLALLCLTKAIVGHDSFYRQIYILVNAGLLVFASLMFVWGLFVSNGRWDISSRFSRIYDVFVAVVIVLWASWMTFTEPFAVFSDWILLCSVFLVYSVLLFSLSELVILSSLVIIGQFLLPLIFRSFSNVETDPDGRDFQAIALAILATAAVLSRVLLYSRIRVYLNWENINRMNLTLKREVSMHLKTTDELEHIRQDLDSKVHRQTKHLREANQRLSEEIAERRYADKVRGILYRISTFVNRHQKLDDVFEFIHSQLEAIMDVKNFFIGQFDEEDYSIHSSFEVAESDLETEDIIFDCAGYTIMLDDGYSNFIYIHGAPPMLLS